MKAMGVAEQSFHGAIDPVDYRADDECEGEVCEGCGLAPCVEWGGLGVMLRRRCAIEAHESVVADREYAAMKEGF